jgi:hypothetical protein
MRPPSEKSGHFRAIPCQELWSPPQKWYPTVNESVGVKSLYCPLTD